MNSDAALTLLSPTNKFVWFWYCLIHFIKSSLSSFGVLAFMWANAKPQSYRCKIPQSFALNDSVPFDRKVGGEWTPSQCFQFVNFSRETNRTIPCELGFEYETFTSSSITTYWDLVCDKAYLSAMVDSCFFVLSIFASTIFTALSDRHGRRPVFVGCILLFSVLSVLSTFAPNVYVYIVFRTLLGPIQHGVYTTGFCFGLELFPMDRRGKPGFLSDLFWIFSCFILCGIVYFVRDWKHYMYVTTLPFLLSVVLLWVMPESIPWLIANGRLDEAKATLLRASRYDASPLSRDAIELKMASVQEPVSQVGSGEATIPVYPVYYVCTRHTLRRQSLLNFVIWVAVGCSYYALQIQAIQVGNPYLNFLIISVIEIPAIILIPALSKCFGRKTLTIGGMLCTAIFLLALIQPKASGSNNVGLLVSLSISGRFTVGLAWTVMFVHITEMYPTNLRSTGIVVGSMSSRLGTAIAPFLALMEAWIVWLPNLCIVVLELAACVSAACLPETKKWQLPETIDHVKEWSAEQKWRCTRKSEED